MKTSKYFWLAVVCLLLAGLAGNAQAQKATTLYPTGVEGQAGPSGMVTVNALQINEGELGFHYRMQTDTTFGLSFFGQTSGDFPGTLTMSLNVTTGGVGTAVNGKSSNLITGGTWTLPVYRTDVRGGFVGSLYGTIEQGEIVPTANPDKSEVSVSLNIQGGTLAYQGATGTATFNGTLTLDGRGGSELEGTLVLNPVND